MIGTVLWLALLAAGISWEAACRLGRRHPGLGRVAARLDARWPGRLALLACWAFAGIHLFARYTLPGRG